MREIDMMKAVKDDEYDEERGGGGEMNEGRAAGMFIDHTEAYMKSVSSQRRWSSGNKKNS
jgi:hypothetical protein